MSIGGDVLRDDAVPWGGPMAGLRGFLAASRSEGRSRSPFGLAVSVIARPSFGPPLREALLPGTGWCQAASSSEPPGERGVGVPSSRSLATASREAESVYVTEPPARIEQTRAHMVIPAHTQCRPSEVHML